ncbi:MAG TPA: MtrB/PioB family decaheme-associated outer membrane protein, partial [Dehalococcoidia bacterium]|nr:MtrB/PioB family decaheme-associated outer membrane protein [Dehalococcoidia bacterium]
RDLPRTDEGGWWGHLFQVPSFRLLGEDRARTRFLEIGGTNLTRMDANYYMNAGLYNYLRFNFEFDRIPHVISHSAQTIYNEVSPGVFQIPGGAVGSGLAGALNAVASTPTAAQRTAVVNRVNALLHPTELGFQSDSARLGLTWLPLPELELSAGYAMTIRDGHIPVGGAFSRGNAVELAAPRDERFHEAKFGAEYARDWYQVRFNYAFSAFENDISKWEWDNPCGGGSTCGATAPSVEGTIGRRSTYPDNYAHTFSGAAGVNFPWWQARLTGGFSYSLWRQNETFLPWSTVAPTSGPFAGVIGNFATDTGATSLDGKMDVVTANVNLTTRPLRNVTTTTRYRYYELDNDTPEHTFSGVFSPEGRPDNTPDPTFAETSEPRAFRKQNASQEVAWRIIPQVTLKGGYEWEHWNRTHREVESSNEHTFRGVVDVRPWPWLLARLSYGQGVRTIGANAYEVPPLMVDRLPQLRKFDEADRTRRKGDVYLQIDPLDTLTLSGSFYGQDDNYFNSAYGLQEAQAFGWSADVSWAPMERLMLYAGYAHDEYKSHQESCAGSGLCNVVTRVEVYSVRPRDLLDSVHAGVNFDIIPRRLDLSLGYRFSFGRSKYAQAGVPGGTAAGEPGPVEDVTNLFHVVNVVARYFLTPNWTLKLGYQYERYDEEDFTTDGIPQALAGLPVSAIAQADARTIVLGFQHPSYEAHIVALTLGYRF